MDLPKFKYHPDPISTGAIKSSDEACECCGKTRGFIYTSTIYAEDEIEILCPWCIADGSAAKKYDGMFSDDYPLQQSGVPDDVISEVCERTPGYISWQQEEWQSHCGTACEFHGDTEKSELEALAGDSLEIFLKKEMIKSDVWENILENYEKGGNPAVYKFKCNKCPEIIYTMDFS
ncbi:MAG: hypothetical protein ACI8XV_002216 [Arenicella sp.]